MSQKGEKMKDTEKTKDQLLEEIKELHSQIKNLKKTSNKENSRINNSNNSLKTVNVPEMFMPPFLKAQDYVKRFFADRDENPEQATIKISGERYILVRAASMSIEFFDLMKYLYRDYSEEESRKVSNGFLFDIAHALGKADAKVFHTKMKVKDPVEKLSAGPIHFAYSGWAFVDILPESRPSADENYFLIYDHPFSFEADSWLTRNRKTDFPVCIMNAGYSSGWCEESFGIPLVAVEIECRSKGDEHCRFIMAPPSKIEEHLSRYSKHSYELSAKLQNVEIPEFFQRKRMEEEIKKYQDHLEELVAKRTSQLKMTNEKLQQEILERIQVEKALKESEEKFRTITENVNVGIYRNTSGPNGRFLEANPAFIQMFGYDSKEELMNINVSNLYSQSNNREKFNKKMLTHGFVKDETLNLRRKDGTEIICSISAVAEKDRKGNILYYDGMIEDITERKKNEDRIKKSLEEKEVLLKEVHHRVKNNMQVIMSLLRLQTNYITDKHAKSLFKDSQSRVASMALIHEKLYKSKDLSSIDFNEYLRDLTQTLIQSYNIGHKMIRFDLDIESVFLNINQAIPCGLIINELITNSLKYAFPGNKRGKIAIDFHLQNEQYYLIVYDNGIGIPPETLMENPKTLGLQLVNALTQQLHGTLELKREDGTAFHIKFKK